MGWIFVPDDREMSDELRKWTRKMGLTEETIDRELESFRDHQYKKPMQRPDACWRNWVKSGIRFGHIVPIQQPKRREAPRELTQEEREAEARRAEENMQRLQQMALKVVK